MDYVFRRPRPKPLGVPDPKRISTPAGQRLSTIVEGTPAEPSRSHRLSNMPMSHRLHLGTPPTHDAEKQPPEYAPVWDSTAPGSGLPGTAKPLDWSGKHGSRGGWKRLAAIIAVVLAVVIALAVGLGVGLTRKSSSQQQQSSSGGTDSDTPQPFPLGQWSLTTALANVDTACTSVPDTWTCSPYTTYSTSPSKASTIFSWDITSSNPSSPSNQSLLISSSNNPFLLMFSNISLTLTDEGQASERYTFSINSPKQVYPMQSLSTDGSRDQCFFNGTVLAAALYTRMQPSFNASATSANGTIAMAAVDSAASNSRSSWQYAIQVDLTQPGGVNVPDCYPITNNVVSGPRITAGLTAQSESSTCQCNYMNYDL